MTSELAIFFFLFKIGLSPYYSYISYIIVYALIQVLRLFIAKKEIPFEIFAPLFFNSSIKVAEVK